MSYLFFFDLSLILLFIFIYGLFLYIWSHIYMCMESHSLPCKTV